MSLERIADLLYGDAAYEVVKSLTPDRPKAKLVIKRRTPVAKAARKIKMAQKGAEQTFDVLHNLPERKEKLLKTVKKSKDSDITFAGEISKVDDDKRQVFGWASVIEKDGKPVVDHQDDVIDLDVIEKAAYDYVIGSRMGGNQHRRTDDDKPHQVSKMIESFLVTPEKKEQLNLPDDFPTGWWCGFQIDDDETWSQVKKGERRGFSIHGRGVRKAVDL